MTDALTALSYWFPKLQAAGLPVPRTAILRMSCAAQQAIMAGFDGKDGTPEQASELKAFCRELEYLAAPLGWPVFLRTDYTSGKHEWARTCCLTRPEDIPRQVFALAGHSELAGIIGLPWDTWVVREFLPTQPWGVAPRFGNMPLCREFRFFVDGPAIACWHPYWPLEALEQGEVDDPDVDNAVLCHEMGKLDDITLNELRGLAAAAGQAVGGRWSVDLLETARGWYVTDMAEADKSWHWPDCPNKA